MIVPHAMHNNTVYRLHTSFGGQKYMYVHAPYSLCCTASCTRTRSQNNKSSERRKYLRLRLTLRLLVMLRVSCSCRLRALIPRSDDVTPVVDDGCWSSCCSKLSTDWPSAFRRAVSAAHSARLWLSFERRLTFSSSKSCHNSETTNRTLAL